MKKVQLSIYLLALIIAVIYLIFTLGFSTNYAVGQGYLGQFYIDAQKANKQMFDLALWIVIFVGGSFLFNTHKNTRFFLGNYVFSLVIFGLMIFAGIVTLSYMAPLKDAYLQIDESVLFILTIINSGEITTKNFDQGVILAYILFFQALLIIGITVLKFRTDIIRAKTKKSINNEVMI